MKRFLEDLDNLVKNTNDMAALVLSMVERSVYSLENVDRDVANSVVEDYSQVDYLDGVIEEDALRILMLYQPMVSDMRGVAVILKVITYMERIGKYSYNIAKGALFLADRGLKHAYRHVTDMGHIAIDMVRMVVETALDKDLSHFDTISDKDQEMDFLRNKVISSSVDYMTKDPGCIDVCTYFISISKFYERIGDHACKSAEKLTYMINGKRVTYN